MIYHVTQYFELINTAKVLFFSIIQYPCRNIQIIFEQTIMVFNFLNFFDFFQKQKTIIVHFLKINITTRTYVVYESLTQFQTF